MKGLSRTGSGLVNKFLFYSEPIVWVEGVEDQVFIEHLVKHRRCRIEWTNGRPNCERLIKELIAHDLPYVVIHDGDYDVLTRRRNRHQRAIMLRRYSIENYVCRSEVVTGVSVKYCGLDDGARRIISTEYIKVLTNITECMVPLVIADATHMTMGTGVSVIPNHPGALARPTNRYLLDKRKVKGLLRKKEKNLDANARKSTAALVRKYLKNRHACHVLRGHFLFALVREFFLSTVSRYRGRRPNLENHALWCLLVAECWRVNRPKDYGSLRRQVGRAFSSLPVAS